MDMHAGPVIAHDRLWHEGRCFAVRVRNIPDGVFQNLQPVRALHQRIELGTDLALAGRCDLVMMYFNLYTLLLECKTDRIADILQGINRWDRKIAAFDRWPMAHVAGFKIFTSGPGRFFGRNFDEAPRHVDVPGHAVEYKKLRFRAKISDVSYPARFEIRLSSLGD